MPALSYTPVMAPQVRSGEKLQTIRPWRTRPFERGVLLYHFQGMRTPACERLGTSDCSSTSEILINLRPGDDLVTVVMDGHTLSLHELEQLARADGFGRVCGPKASMEEVIHAFGHWFVKTPKSRPFSGQVIRWESITPPGQYHVRRGDIL